MGLLMEESVYAENKNAPIPVIVDLGYISDAATRGRHGLILAYGISHKNFSQERLRKTGDTK